MNIDQLQQAFERLAQRLGTRLQRYPDRPGLLCIELESPELGEGYLRLCADRDDALAIVETALPFASLVPPDAPAQDRLLALQFLAWPFPVGGRTFAAFDAQNEHVVLSRMAGAAALRNEDDLLALAEDCVAHTAMLAQTAALLRPRQPVLEDAFTRRWRASAKRTGSLD
jgi:hypothetical protein